MLHIVLMWTFFLTSPLPSTTVSVHCYFSGCRYEAMRQLEAAGDYFSDEEMKCRDPLLYEDMIGQHLTDEDVSAMLTVDKTMEDHALSEVLLQHIQVMQNNKLYEQLKAAEVCMHNLCVLKKTGSLKSC